MSIVLVLVYSKEFFPLQVSEVSEDSLQSTAHGSCMRTANDLITTEQKSVKRTKTNFEFCDISQVFGEIREYPLIINSFF